MSGSRNENQILHTLKEITTLITKKYSFYLFTDIPLP